MATRRSDQLRTSVKSFLETHAAWQEDENRPNPDASYWDAVDVLLDTFDAGDIPGDCRDLNQRVDNLREKVGEFDDSQQENESVLMPSGKFFSAVEGVERALKGSEPRELKPLETIAELREQKVDDSQIAKIWGFTDRDGEAMPQLVKRELATPGSVTKTPGAVDGRDWRDPRIEDQEIAEEPAVQRRVKGDKKRKQAEDKPCPETAETLWEQGVPFEQAARMLQIKPDAVKAMFDGFDQALEASMEKAGA